MHKHSKLDRMKTMNQTLEKCITRMRDLPNTTQAQLANVIGELIDDIRGGAQFEDDMKDPAYRAYVEKALAEGEADIAAGRCAPIGEVFGDIERDFKATHGL